MKICWKILQKKRINLRFTGAPTFHLFMFIKLLVKPSMWLSITCFCVKSRWNEVFSPANMCCSHNEALKLREKLNSSNNLKMSLFERTHALQCGNFFMVKWLFEGNWIDVFQHVYENCYWIDHDFLWIVDYVKRSIFCTERHRTVCMCVARSLPNFKVLLQNNSFFFFWTEDKMTRTFRNYLKWLYYLEVNHLKKKQINDSIHESFVFMNYWLRCFSRLILTKVDGFASGKTVNFDLITGLIQFWLSSLNNLV